MTALSSAAFDAWKAKALNVPIEDELARRGVRLRGKTERAGPCPKCGGDDRFSINTAKQLFNCRHCGVGGSVIDLVCHLDGTDFKTACTTLTGEPPPNGKDKDAPKPVEVVRKQHVYVDEIGNTVIEIGRIEYQYPDRSYVLKNGKRKKSFRQKRPDPNNPGAWVYNTDGARIVPYHLPQLIEAIGNDRTVLIVEGEGQG
jgi:CHC2 zinc finger